MKRLILAVAFSLAASSAQAASWPEPMTAPQLGAVRAGYVTLDGVTFSFAVTLQTFVNGQLALSSSMALDSPAGSTFTVGGGASATSGASPGSSSAILAGGNTTLLQQFTTNSIRNVVATSASNQMISQNANVTLALAGFQQNQAAYQVKNVASSIATQLAAGLLIGR